MVREPAPRVVEQTAKRTATTAVHVPPVQEQVEIELSHSVIFPFIPSSNMQKKHDSL